MSKGGSADRSAGEAAAKQAQIAEQLFNQSAPLRQGLTARSMDYLQNGVDNSPTFSAFKAAAEPQYANARNQIIEDTPAGGPLTAALAQLQMGKARDLTQARGAIDESELSRALTLGTGLVPTSVGGLGNSAAINAQRAQTKSAQESSVYMAIGEGLGAFMGGK